LVTEPHGVNGSGVPAWLAERAKQLDKPLAELSPDDFADLVTGAAAPEARPTEVSAGQQVPERKLVKTGADWWVTLPAVAGRGEAEPPFLAKPSLKELGTKLIDEWSVGDGAGWRAVLLPLSFYPGAKLLQLTDMDFRHEAMFLTSTNTDKGVELIFLDGTSTPVHEFNETRLDMFAPSSVRDYVRFFCQVVHGDEGPFRIIEPRMKGGEVLPELSGFLSRSEADRPELLTYESGDRAQPMRIERFTPGGQVHVRALVFYGKNIFRALFAVDPAGMIEMLDDEPLA
jgi:hypothetical protein